MDNKKNTAALPPKVPQDNVFRQATRTVVEVNRKVLEALKDK